MTVPATVHFGSAPRSSATMWKLSVPALSPAVALRPGLTRHANWSRSDRAYPWAMSKPLPIACTLSAGELAARVAELRALGADGLVSVTEVPGRAELRFRPGADTRRRVEAA